MTSPSKPPAPVEGLEARIVALEHATDCLFDLLQECKDQWGDDYLWEKWDMDKAIERVRQDLAGKALP